MKLFLFISSAVLAFAHFKAQVSYDAAAAYGMRKLNPSYTGSAIQVRRTCDNGTRDIGFTSCGDLDTTALKTFVVASNPLSAMTVVSATAFSLRRLRCTYTGFAVRVRSSAVGSPTLDIGFTPNGDLDTASLKTFIGSNSAFVTIWYDQSGNGRNASQTVNANQPQLVNAGVVERQNNRPAVRFLGMNCKMATAPYTTYGSAACFNGVARVNTNLTYNTILNKTTANFPAPLDLYNGQMVIGSGPSYNFFAYGQTFNASLPLSIWTYQASSGGSYNFYYNGSQTGTGAVGFYGDGGNPLVLGGRDDGLTGLNGWIMESLTFNSIPTATDRVFLEWSQSQYYETSGPTLALPVAPASASVSIWYDQSGTGKHAVQATAANQPRLINSGVVEKNGSIPAINFTGFPRNLVAPLSTNAYPVSISVLANTSGASTGGAFVKLGTNVNAGQAGIAIGIGASGLDFDSPGTSLIAVKEFLGWNPSSPNVNYPTGFFISTTTQQTGAGGMTSHLNGANVPLTGAATAVGASIAGNLFIGGYTNIANRFPLVKESEVIVLPSSLSTTRRILLETNQAAYNGITITNNKYTPPSANNYHRFVNGVGRESVTDSVAGTRSTTGMGISIGATAADFLKNNGDYLTYGVHCLSPATTSSLNLPAAIMQRWFNDWYLNKTDVSSNNGTINFFFDFSDYGLGISPGLASNYELLSRNSPSGAFSIVAGTTKSVVGDRVYFSVDAANIPGNTYYTIGTRATSPSPLPIDLLNFELVCTDYKVQVKWTTARQYNNAYFTIERSKDGELFETLETIKGAGTSNQKLNYAFTDYRPLDGTAYYRLKQTDSDGSEKTFPLYEVSCQSPPLPISIYPNPTNGTFILEGSKMHSDVTIVSALGQSVYEKKNIAFKQEINLGHLPDGIYFIVVTDPSGKYLFKLILQR